MGVLSLSLSSQRLRVAAMERDDEAAFALQERARAELSEAASAEPAARASSASGSAARGAAARAATKLQGASGRALQGRSEYDDDYDDQCVVFLFTSAFVSRPRAARLHLHELTFFGVPAFVFYSILRRRQVRRPLGV